MLRPEYASPAFKVYEAAASVVADADDAGFVTWEEGGGGYAAHRCFVEFLD